MIQSRQATCRPLFLNDHPAWLKPRCVRSMSWCAQLSRMTWGGLTLAGLLATDMAVAMDIVYSPSLRYRYEHYSRDAATAGAENTTSKASTVRFGLGMDATLRPTLNGFIEFETVEQIFEDDYNIPTIPAQTIAGYPVIADPQGTEVNQAFLKYSPIPNTFIKLGRQEIVLNNGRFISNSGWRQNHQSFNAVSFSATPSTVLKLDYGYLSRVLRVVGAEATNGRVDMASHFFNLAYTKTDVGVLKLYGVYLDFDTEAANSTNTTGIRFEGNSAYGADRRVVSTVEYAQQSDSGDNPSEVSADYISIEAGVLTSGITYRVGYTILEGSSSTNKFSTPLAHPFNGWTELFATNPSLGTNNHGLAVWSLTASGPLQRWDGLSFTAVYYDYSPDTGSDHYGSEIDLGLEYKVIPANKNWTVGWRFGQYMADKLFSDALRTSVYTSYTF